MLYQFLSLLLMLLSVLCLAQRPQIIVTTDLGQDPDDQQSLVRLLHYTNEFDLKGIILNADANYAHEAPKLREDVARQLIDAYGKIEASLNDHAEGYPTSSYLHSVVKRGTFGNGNRVPVEHYVGLGHDTDGSNWIIEVIDNSISQPVIVSVWGGACDLAQALWKVKNTREPDQLADFVGKIRAFFIGKQDSSNDWIISNFPNMWLILALDPGGDKWQSGYRGMFWGGDMSNTTRTWLHKYVIGQNELGDLYPDKAHTGGAGKNPHGALKEGDSPAMLYFLPNGLNVLDHPEWGSWGGRYQLERNQFYTDASDTYFDLQAVSDITSPRATVFRWRKDFQNDFANRVRWGSNSTEDQNHHPVIFLNGVKGKEPAVIDVVPGEEVVLDASLSIDPDSNRLFFEWIDYPEINVNCTPVQISDKKSSKIKIVAPHVNCDYQIILRLTDDGEIPMVSYKRVILSVQQPD